MTVEVPVDVARMLRDEAVFWYVRNVARRSVSMKQLETKRGGA